MKCGFLGGSDGKESACNAGDPGLIPKLGRSSLLSCRSSLYILKINLLRDL